MEFGFGNHRISVPAAALHRGCHDSALWIDQLWSGLIHGITLISDQRASAEAMQTSYGFRDVDAGEKQHLVDDVFHRVARRYDIMNDLMSAGFHRVWKDAMVASLNPPSARAGACSTSRVGTGDIAFRIVDASGGNARATILDINGSMLGVGRERAEKRGLADNVEFVEANAEDLPFADASFDAYTIAFGIRNVPRIDRALDEAYRVLKPGGRFLCLEFSAVELPLLDKAYEAFSFT